MRRLVFLSALLAASAPGLASAQLSVIVGDFGDHMSGGGSINFTTQPIGIAECEVMMPFVFSGITSPMPQRYIDVWSASSTGAMCEVHTNRTGTAMPPCTYVDLPSSVNTYMTTMTFPMNVTPLQLFGSCESATRTFYMFDSAGRQDTATTFTAAQSVAIEIIVDGDAPAAPVVSGNAAGDATVMVSWTTSAADSGLYGARVYFDPNGCAGGDGGSGSSTLVAGAPAPDAAAFEQLGQSVSSVTVPIANFGWAATDYTARGAIAVTLLDRARNESVLSNVVCVEHVQVEGFWDQYCSERGLSMEECTAQYNGCSVGVPSRRIDSSVLAALAMVLGALFVRRRAR